MQKTKIKNLHIVFHNLINDKVLSKYSQDKIEESRYRKMSRDYLLNVKRFLSLVKNGCEKMQSENKSSQV